jgi:pimeloyl-ACP methyl ester carboxylesterase
MNGPVLLIPGTQATTLRDQLGQRVYNAVRVSLPLVPASLGNYPRDRWVPLMSMEYAPGALRPARTSLLPGTALNAGSVVASPYQPLPAAWERWGYDWREDIRANAERLLDDLRGRAARGEGRATLVTHSQGGLIAVVASKLAPQEIGTLVSRVLMVAPPLAGTMRAVEGLVFGSDGLGKAERHRALAMARTWPAAYQMLPNWPCVTDEAGNPLPEDRQLLSPGGWPVGPGEPPVPQDMLDRARAVQALLRDPLSAFGPSVELAVILGTDQPTPQRIERRGDTFTRMVAAPRSGDNLVPLDRTVQQVGPAFRTVIVPFGRGIRPHAELCADATVARSLRDRVAAPAPQPA